VVDAQRQDGTSDIPDEQPEQPAPSGGGPTNPEPAVPSEAELADVAEPAVLRHAPKVGAFITAGVLLGALLGLVLALVAGPSSELRPDGSAFIGILDGQGGVRLASAFAGALIGALVGAGLALLADRRSVRRAEPDRRG
jgi:hypothetical protein